MLPVQFASPDDKPTRILLLGAHPDDIEIGCGATVLFLKEAYKNIQIRWVVLSGSERRRAEAIESADKFLEDVPSKEISTVDFRDAHFASQISELKEYFESDLKVFNPHIIFTHRREDLHQDHRMVSEVTWNTFRDHTILEYEVVKFDGDLGKPNVFVPVSEEIVNRKVAIITECFGSQNRKNWFSKDTFRSILRIRGVESASPTRYSEAFYARKLLMG